MENPRKETRKRKRILLSGPGEPEPEPPKIDGYEIIEPLGAGGMGIVWRVKQLGTNREVALKVMSQNIMRSKGRAKIRFEREVTIAARLEHPNIARVYESGIHKNHYFYAMELIHGEALNQYVQHQKLSTQEILKLIQKICQAVQHAHQSGIIHRDLKHSNIMVADDGQPKVLDFGLARDLLAYDSDRKVSLDGDVVGTPDFMSPEQAAGDIDSVDTRSDVYSLGVILYDLLINRLPYNLTGQHYTDLKMIQEQEPIRPSNVVPRIERDLESILLKSLAKIPSERYRSAGELADDIDNWLKDLPVTARSVDLWYIARKHLARHRVAATIVFLVLTIMISNGFISTYLYRRAENKNQQLQETISNNIQAQQRNLAIVHQALFKVFLELWYDGQKARAQGLAQSFPKNSTEDIGARFLLDGRPLEEKEQEYQVKLAHNPALFEFLVGEQHRKNGDLEQSILAYKRCIEVQQPSSEFDTWLVTLAKKMILDSEGKVANPKSDQNLSSREDFHE